MRNLVPASVAGVPVPEGPGRSSARTQAIVQVQGGNCACSRDVAPNSTAKLMDAQDIGAALGDGRSTVVAKAMRKTGPILLCLSARGGRAQTPFKNVPVIDMAAFLARPA